MTDENGSARHEERIRMRAYLIWEKEGQPEGRAIAHWIRAKEEIEAEEKFPSESSSAGTSQAKATP